MLKVVRNLRKASAILVAALFFSVPLVFSVGTTVNAETVDYSVYVAPSLKISISSNPVVLNLNPNSKPFGTADVDVSVGTNNLYGYQLFMNTDSNATSLERDSTADSITASIPTLSNGSSSNPCNTSYTSSTFTANSWGYRINNSVGGESNCIDTTSTNYYSYTPGTMISSSTTATNEQTANLTFASKIDYDKPAGEYELTLKMKALPIVTTYYMQDIATSPTLADTICTEEPTVVIDKRDEQPYTIRRINGNCWMTENLRFGYNPTNPISYDITIDPLGTNIDTAQTLNVKDLVLNDCRSNGTIPPTTNLCIHSGNDGSGNPTVWYNYAVASAGTIMDTYNSNSQIYDLCPAGWRMPSSDEFRNITGYYSQFNPVMGGTYNGASLDYPQYGDYYSSSVYNDTNRYRLVANDSNLTMTVSNSWRGGGRFVRCILRDNSRTLSDITYMQDVNPDVVYYTAAGASKTIKDKRDEQGYLVSKLDDGRLWMLDNFNLDLTNSTTINTLTSTNTNASDTALNYLKNGGGTASDQWATAGLTRTNWTGTTNSYTEPLVNKSGSCKTTLASPCTYDGSYTNVTNLSTLTTDPALAPTPSVSTFGPGSGKIGIHYNYCAASAGSYCYDDTGTASSDAQYDICPANWRLPTGDGDNGELQILCTAINGGKCVFDVTTMDAANPNSMQYKLSTPLSGSFSLGYGRVQGSVGYYVSSDYANATAMLGLAVSPTVANPGTNTGGFTRNGGRSIRCIAR